MIDIKNLQISFEDKIVLDNVNIEFPRTGLICICGESGSGKTSLINAISSLIPFEGSINFDGVKIECLDDKEGADFRIKNIGFVFQDFKLLPKLTVYENVAFALECLGSNSKNIKNKVMKAIEIVGKDNLLLDPDCGLRRAPKDVAFEKLKLMNEIKNI